MRYYSSTAVAMALTGSVNEIVTTIVVDTVLGLPAQTPFTLVLDVGLSTEEIVTVTEVSGTSLTVTRGEDGSTAIAHTAGAVVRHMMTARDLREPAVHVDATANVHGIGATASVVGTDTAQTLTNKTVNFADNTVLGIPQASVTDLVDNLAALVLADADLGAGVAVIVGNLAEHVALAAILPTPLTPAAGWTVPAGRNAPSWDLRNGLVVWHGGCVSPTSTLASGTSDVTIGSVLAPAFPAVTEFLLGLTVNARMLVAPVFVQADGVLVWRRAGAAVGMATTERLAIIGGDYVAAP